MTRGDLSADERDEEELPRRSGATCVVVSSSFSSELPFLESLKQIVSFL